MGNRSTSSNLVFCAKKHEDGFTHPRVFLLYFRRDSRVGAVLREKNALPYRGREKTKLTAKDDVNNVGAGRAAKGANHFAPAIYARFSE